MREVFFWSLSNILILESNPIILKGIFRYPWFNLLSFRIVIKHFIFWKGWRNTFHSIENSTILFFRLYYFSFCNRIHETIFKSFGCRLRCVTRYRLYFLELIKKFKIWLCNFVVLLIESMSKWLTLCIFNILELTIAIVIIIQVRLSFLSDPLELFDMIFVGSIWNDSYAFWLNISVIAGGLIMAGFMSLLIW